MGTVKLRRSAQWMASVILALATLVPAAQPAAADPIIVWGATQEPPTGTATSEVFQRIDAATGAVLQSINLTTQTPGLAPNGATGAGLAVVNGRLLACAGNIGDRRVLCFDARDGTAVGNFSTANLGGTFPHGFAVGPNPGLAMITDPNADQAVVIDVAQSLATGQAVSVSNVVSTCTAGNVLRFDIRGGATGLNGDFYITGAFDNGRGFLSKGFLALRLSGNQLIPTRRVERTDPAGAPINAGPLGVLCQAAPLAQINPTGATGSLDGVLLLEDTGGAAAGGSNSVRRVDPNTGTDLGQAFTALNRMFDAMTESFDQATGRITSQGAAGTVPTNVNPPGSTGLAGFACASAVGQTCTATGNVTGTWTKTASGTFSFTATGPATTAPGSTPAIFLATTTGVESFPCRPVGFAVPFTATCTGTTVGDPLQNSVVTVRFLLVSGGTQDVTGTISGLPSLNQQQAIALVQPSGQQGQPCAQFPGQTCQVTGAVQGTGTLQGGAQGLGIQGLGIPGLGVQGLGGVLGLGGLGIGGLQGLGGIQGAGTATGPMSWTLTAASPVVVAPGIIPIAVISTTQGLQAFPCTAVAAGQTTVTCTGTTAGVALANSTVSVVFARAAIATGTVTAGLGGLGGANVPLLPPLPPLPPPPFPPLPPLPPPPPPWMMQQQMQQPDMMQQQMPPMMGPMGDMPMMPGMRDVPMRPTPTPTPTPTPGPSSEAEMVAPPMRPAMPVVPMAPTAPLVPDPMPVPAAPPSGQPAPAADPAALPGDPMLPQVADQP
jgi:hypothetical protein